MSGNGQQTDADPNQVNPQINDRRDDNNATPAQNTNNQTTGQTGEIPASKDGTSPQNHLVNTMPSYQQTRIAP